MEHIAAGSRFDLLFTDIVMPGSLNGIALARELRARDPSLPVLFTSGFSSGLSLRNDLDAFDAQLIAKPYRKAELAAAVRAVLKPTSMAAN
jgi:DNA-binding response OmpR family regulator